MSSSRARKQEPGPRNREDAAPGFWLLLPGAYLLLLLLAGCGFHPLYAESTRATDEPALAAITVLPIKDRIGQMLELSLRETLNPGGITVEQRYRLRVGLSISRVDLGILADATSTRARVDVVAIFDLEDAQSGKSVYRSRTQSTSAFNILDDAYAAQVSEDDARARTVRDLSDEIRTRLAIYLRQRRAG
jgi:LPS-assembly lipoprotein